MVKLLDIKRFLDETFLGLAPQDFSNNGLQLDAGVADVRKMAFAVDACQKTFDMAAASNAQLLFVHHGFSWGGGIKYLNGYTGRRVATLMQGGVSLYACHLPLDMHPVHGNNAVLCRMLDLQDAKPFFAYHGENIGFCGSLPKPMELSEIASIMDEKLHAKSRFFAAADRPMATIGIVSGGGDDAIDECASLGIDCLLTGEFRHQCYHPAMEMGVSVIASGHYATETTGVKAVMELIAANFDVETIFLDVPTGL